MGSGRSEAAIRSLHWSAEVCQDGPGSPTRLLATKRGWLRAVSSNLWVRVFSQPWLSASLSLALTSETECSFEQIDPICTRWPSRSPQDAIGQDIRCNALSPFLPKAT